MPPFRQPAVSDEEDEWTPPSYAGKPIDESDDKSWTPPDYAGKPIEEEKKKEPSELKKVLTPAKSQNITGQISSAVGDISEAAKKYLGDHPSIGQTARRFMSGPSQEETQGHKLVGQELTKIPGMEKAGDWIRNKGINTGNYWGGVLGSIAGDVVSGASTGFDPRTAGVDHPSFNIPETAPKEPPIRQSREIPYKNEVIPAAKAPEQIELPIKQSNSPATPKAKPTFVNPFEKKPIVDTAEKVKPTAVFKYEGPEGKMYDIKDPDNVTGVDGEIGYHKSTVGEDRLKELGIDVPESPTQTEKLSGDELRKRALEDKQWKPPDYAGKPIEEGFGGSGHPDDPDYTSKVLSKAGSGEPGLNVEDKEGFKHVVYRNTDGDPVAVAKIVTDQTGNNLIQDLAADKSKGLLTGRAMKSVGDKLVEMNATEPAGTISNDAQNFLNKMKESVANKKTFESSITPREDFTAELPEPPIRQTNAPPNSDFLNQNVKSGRYSPEDLAKAKIESDRLISNPPTRSEDWKAPDYAGKPIEENATDDKSPSDDISYLHGGIGAVGKGPMKLDPSTGPYASALDKLFNSMGKTLENRVQQDVINKAERAKRFGAFASVKQEGMAGAKKSLSALKGEFDHVDQDKLMLGRNETDSLFTAVKRAKITEGEKARGYTALFKILKGEGVPQRNELAILDQVFGNGFADKVTQMHGGIGAVGLKLAKVANTAKSMQNSLSLAAPLRHGVGMIARKEFYPAFADMFKFFGDKEFYNSSMQALEERPNYMLGREAGLFIAKPSSLLDSEEEFMNSYVGKLPVVRDVVGASQRGYIGFLNKLRADTFDSMIKQAEGLGVKTDIGEVGEDGKSEPVPSKETEAIAKYINNATGRGDLPGNLNKITNELNAVLWSPRMITSRITMLTNPKIYMDLPKGMRLDGLKSLFGIAALGTTIDTLGAYAGAKISTNILSSDFMKGRFGTERIDPWGGFQQYIVAAARFLAGKTDSSQPTSRLAIAGRFAASKESPAANFVHELLMARKFTGNSLDPSTAGNFTDEYGNKTSIQGEIVKRFTPIFLQDLQDLVNNNPNWASDIGLDTAITGASALGMSQNYTGAPKSKFGFKKLSTR